jgi:ADP-ribosylglycohydrolase
MTTEYTMRSLEGIWVGDCIGNLGQLYFVHDILKALEGGLVKFGGQLGQFHKQFQYSDDTEEAIVLYNHLLRFPHIDQDKLAMEFATRFMERDPDGEIYGYGLNTRKVLKDIYDGVPWQQANQIIVKSEGMPSHIDSLVDSLSCGKGFSESILDARKQMAKQMARQEFGTPQGSCGNGAAMRVALLGAFIAEKEGMNDKVYDWSDGLTSGEMAVTAEAKFQATVTHDHPEGQAGAVAIATLAYLVTRQLLSPDDTMSVTKMYDKLIQLVPSSQVASQIAEAKGLPFSTPIGKAVEILGNGSHVTCQDTVPLCVWLALKHLSTNSVDEMYEKAIIEASMAFGDVDTNCAIVGGVVGIVSPPPEKWKNFCEPMDMTYYTKDKRFNLNNMTESGYFPYRR